MMNNGFVPLATASPLVKVADPAANAQLCYEEILKAADQGAKVVAFPEMTLTSYIANDLLYHGILLESAERELGRLVERTSGLDVLFSVGMPLCVNGKIYNVLAICHAGRILGVVPKTFIPTYGVDFEGRWFSSGPAEVSPISVAGQDNVPFGSHQVFRNAKMPQMCLGFEICEDIWSPDPPSIKLALAGATILINGSASNASLDKDVYRRGLISGQSARLLACYAYCSSGTGDSTGDVTVGGQEIIAENGTILAEAKPFGAAFAIADIDVESLWGARRGMSSFHVAATPADAGYAETFFDMEIDERPLNRPVSSAPFLPAKDSDVADCCDLALAEQAHGLLARIHNQGVTKIVIDATGSGEANAALAIVATARGAALASLDASAVHVVTSSAAGSGRLERLAALARTFGFSYDELKMPATPDATAVRQYLFQQASGASTLVVTPTDMTELALGLTDEPTDVCRQYGINSQMVRSFIAPMLRRFAERLEIARNYEGIWADAGCSDPETTSKIGDAATVAWFADEGARTSLRSTLADIAAQSEPIAIPAHDPYATAPGHTAGPVEVVDFYIDGLLRAQYRPAKLFRLAKAAFAGKYADGDLLDWMEAFYSRFFATQFMRYSLPDGPRIASAGLDLHSGVMLPNFADPTLWLDEVKSLR